jgi:geranylgeranyl reductase family protein
MKATRFDVVVVGAGPAGALAAYELGRLGLRTALLEKHRFPRDKTCGGGLTYKVGAIVPFDLSAVIEQTISNFDLSWRLGPYASLRSDRSLIHFVTRRRFDAYLVERALAGGNVAFFEGVAARHVELVSDGARVVSDWGDFGARYVLGADGANGCVARALDLLRDRVLLPAVECQVAVDAITLDTWRDRVALDFGTLPGSYGWVFPKGDHLNIGVGTLALSNGAARDLTRYERAHLAQRLPRHRVTHRSGAVLPLRMPGTPIQRGCAMLTGDAAGLVEALTGEGIYWALRSGLLAARAIAEAAATGAVAPRYQEAIDRELMPDLLEARRLAHLHLWWPRSCYVLPTRWPRAWRAVQHLLRGERQFTDVRGRLGAVGRLVGLIPTAL